jgi:hypothetical protein
MYGFKKSFSPSTNRRQAIFRVKEPVDCPEVKYREIFRESDQIWFLLNFLDVSEKKHFWTSGVDFFWSFMALGHFSVLRLLFAANGAADLDGTQSARVRSLAFVVSWMCVQEIGLFTFYTARVHTATVVAAGGTARRCVRTNHHFKPISVHDCFTCRHAARLIFVPNDRCTPQKSHTHFFFMKKTTQAPPLIGRKSFHMGGSRMLPWLFFWTRLRGFGWKSQGRSSVGRRTKRQTCSLGKNFIFTIKKQLFGFF